MKTKKETSKLKATPHYINVGNFNMTGNLFKKKKI